MNYVSFFCLSKNGFTVKGILVVAALIALAGWLLLPRYFAQMEKTQSLSMQAMLINTAIAEDAYFIKHQTYTDVWKTLTPHLLLPPSLETAAEPVEGNPSEMFFTFGAKEKKKSNGFTVTLRLNSDGQGGVITAARTGGLRHRYTLLRPFPLGDTECIAEDASAREFCRSFVQTAQMFDVKNLIPVPASKESESKS